MNNHKFQIYDYLKIINILKAKYFKQEIVNLSLYFIIIINYKKCSQQNLINRAEQNLIYKGLIKLFIFKMSDIKHIYIKSKRKSSQSEESSDDESFKNFKKKFKFLKGKDNSLYGDYLIIKEVKSLRSLIEKKDNYDHINLLLNEKKDENHEHKLPTTPCKSKMKENNVHPKLDLSKKNKKKVLKKVAVRSRNGSRLELTSNDSSISGPNFESEHLNEEINCNNGDNGEKQDNDVEQNRKKDAEIFAKVDQEKRRTKSI